MRGSFAWRGQLTTRPSTRSVHPPLGIKRLVRERGGYAASDEVAPDAAAEGAPGYPERQEAHS